MTANINRGAKQSSLIRQSQGYWNSSCDIGTRDGEPCTWRSDICAKPLRRVLGKNGQLS